MGRKATALVALAALVGAVFALAPSAEVRELPVPEVVEAPPEGGTLVVDLVDGASEADLQAVEALLGADLDWTSPLAIDEALAVGEVEDLDAAIARLGGHPLVEVAEQSLMMEAFGWPDDPMYEKQWNLPAIGAPAAWASTPRGRGVIVAVIDTGVTRVEDLEGTRILEGASFVPGTRDASDDNGHGTHVAGTIAQTTHNGKGVAGVAPEATILPIKVLSGGGFGQSAWIAAGIDHAADEGAHVINLSLGGGYSLVIHNAIRKARKQGVIVVAAAGNSGRQGVSYPGGLAETIGVSAVGPEGTLAPYSSWGRGVDVAAPGGDKRKAGGGILQDTVDGRGGHHYAEYQGTSMATPHVAGAAAVLLSTGAVDADTVERLLLRSARGTSWDPKIGHGTLDLGGAVGMIGKKHGGMRFALGVGVALLVSSLGATGAGFRAKAAVLSGLVAGGAFFLGGLGAGLLWQLLGSGLLTWPGLLLGHEWTHFPLWLSCAVPAAATVFLGAFRPLRPLAFALCAGVAAHLFYGASTGTLEPWWMPESLARLWLGGNATVALVLAMALAGAEAVDRRKRS